VINNAWTCSAGVIGSHAPAVVELGLTDSSAADGLCYSPAGNNLRHAREGWRCSSGVIGSTAPSVSSQPTSTEQADSDPTIVKEPRTAQPAAEQTEVEQTAIDLKRVHVVQHAIPFNEGQTSDIGFVKRTTSYINVPNGNVANGSAQLRMQSNDFVTRARARHETSPISLIAILDKRKQPA